MTSENKLSESLEAASPYFGNKQSKKIEPNLHLSITPMILNKIEGNKY